MEYSTKEFVAKLQKDGYKITYRTLQMWRVSRDGNPPKFPAGRYERKGRIAIYLDSQLDNIKTLLKKKSSPVDTELTNPPTNSEIISATPAPMDAKESESPDAPLTIAETDTQKVVANTDTLCNTETVNQSDSINLADSDKVPAEPSVENGDKKNIVETVNEDSAQKNKLVTTDATSTNNVQIVHGKNTTGAEFSQVATVNSVQIFDKTNRTILENLPAELLNQKRFFPVDIIGGDKVPQIKQWQNPNKQKLYSQLTNPPLYGFDTCGHGRGVDYLMLDFDNVLTEQGEFVNNNAKTWYQWIQSRFNGYAEKSISGRGIRIFAVPSQNKFSRITNKDGVGVLHFDKVNPKVKLELFYKSAARFSVVTGDIFNTTSREIIKGEVADEVLETLLNQIQLQYQAANPAPQKKKTKDPYKNFSADTKDLIDRINAITPEQLETKGYLLRSEHGAPYPTGFICPWCGSGTHEHKTGALTFYETPNPHFTCHAKSCGGDVINFLAKIYAIDNHGEEFFTLLKKAADDFAIPYDKKIFKYRPAPKKSFETAALMDGEERTQDFIADCPINLRIPANFEFSNKGIQHITPPREGKDEPPKIKVVARTPLVITNVLTTCTKTKKTQYEVAMKIGDSWRVVTADGRTLQDPRRVLDLTDNGALIEEPAFLAKYFSRLIACNRDIIKKTKVYTKPGWHGDKFIYPIGGTDYICRRSNIDYESLFSTKGDKDVWTKKFVEATCKSPIHRIFVGAAAASTFLETIGEPNFWLHIFGKKNSSKTPLLKLALSIFGNPNKLMRTFDSSAKNMVAMAVGLNSFPQGIDELETLNKKGEEELQKAIYDLHAGKDKQKNTRSGDVKEVETFCTVRLTTGEKPVHKPTDKGGAYKRAIDLYISDNLFDVAYGRDLHLFLARNHGHYGRAWTEYNEKFKDEIIADFDATSKELFATFGTTFEPAHITAFAASTVGFWHLRKCMELEEKFDSYHALADARMTLRLLPTAEEISDTKRGVDLLSSWIDEHPKNFIVENENGDFISALSFGETSGIKFADGRIGFFRNAFRRICEEELHLPSFEKFLNELFDEGKLICPSRREKAKSIRLSRNEIKKVYLFNADVLLTFDNSTDEYEGHNTN